MHNPRGPKCKYCKKPIKSPKNGKVVIVCLDPLLTAVFTTCSHCGNVQPSLVMDKLQGDYAVEYEKTRKIINETRHPAAIRFARKKEAELSKKIRARNTMLLDKYEELRKEGKLINAKR